MKLSNSLLLLLSTTSRSNAFITTTTTSSSRFSSSPRSPMILFDTTNEVNGAVKDAPIPDAVKTSAGRQVVVDEEEVEVEATPFFEKLVEGIKFRYSLFQDAKDEGYNFKQSMACAMAGEYDEGSVKEEINDIITSHPCVMFTWESSPSCKQAVTAFEKVGADVKNVRLDDPWSDGNPIRAEIGKMVGRSSVPMIFIAGEYVGGYDGGVSEDAPGILGTISLFGCNQINFPFLLLHSLLLTTYLLYSCLFLPFLFFSFLFAFLLFWLLLLHRNQII